MIELIRDNFIIDVVCSAYDLGETETLKDIHTDEWNHVSGNVNVLYLSKAKARRIIAVFEDRRPDIVYINGIFLPLYTWLPLVVAKVRRMQVVLSPRGMLQDGALAKGSLKKFLAIVLLRASGAVKHVLWQATDEQEVKDIRRSFGHQAAVKLVKNVPKPPLLQNTITPKRANELSMVYLSLISAKKNLAFVLETLKGLKQRVSFHVYGPIKDCTYWRECLSHMEGQIHDIRYCGAVQPAMVQSTLKQYHAFVLLTKGENFGHAVYEAMSAGTPAVISPFTPWGDLARNHAGITVGINDTGKCLRAFEHLLAMDQKEFAALSEGAYQLACQYYNSDDFKSLYIDLFSAPSEIKLAQKPKLANLC